MSNSTLARAIANGRSRLSRKPAEATHDSSSGDDRGGRVERKPTLNAYIRRRARAHHSASVDDLLGKSDPNAALNRMHGDEGATPDVVAAGLSRMRLRTLDDAASSPESFLSRPLWLSALEDQRELDMIRLGRPEHWRATGERGEVVEFDPAEVSAWPSAASSKPLMDWSSWHTCPENQQASESANVILDEPASRLNPLVVVGSFGSGKTHLISALSSSFLAQAPPGHPVLEIDASHVPVTLPDGWMARIGRSHAILIDDIDAAFASGSDDRLGNALAHGRDLGAQIVIAISDTTNLEQYRASALAVLMRNGAKVRLTKPSPESIAAMLRRLSLSRGVSLDEEILFLLAAESRDWSGARNGFEQVAMAIEAGKPPMEGSDIRAILEGRWFGTESEGTRIWDVEEVGRRIVSDVLDEVLPSAMETTVVADPIEAHLSSDWTPDVPKSARGNLSLVPPPEPSKTPLLDHIHLVPQEDSRLDELVDSAFNRVEEDLHRRRFSLREIEGELHRIRARIPLADQDESISLTDRLLALEGHLDKLAETPLGVNEPAIEDFKPPSLIQRHPFPVLEPNPGESPFDVKKRAPDGVTRIRRRFILLPDGGMSPVRTRLVRA